MTLRDMEKAIWQEAKTVLNNPKLRLKDILEWSNGEIEPEEEGEIVAQLPVMRIYVCVLKEHDKRASR